MRSIRFCLIVIGTILSALGAACSTAPQHRVAAYEDAMRTRVSIVSIKPWDDYKNELQPKFDLKAADALGKTLPTTLRTQDAIATQLSAEFDLGRVKGGGPSSDALKDLLKADSKASANTTKAPDAAAIAAPLADLGKDLDRDPMLQYLAATALYQEVKMLDTYIADAAIETQGRKAFIVRMQITAMPRRRYQPYDLYSTIGVYPLKDKSLSGTGVLTLALPTNDKQTAVEVLPLLVSDNLEAAIRQSSRQHVVDLALAATAASAAVGVGGQAGAGLAQLERVLARDYNSLLTVGRLSPSTLQVRFGAPAIGQEEYAATTRNQYVTFLVIADASTTRLQLTCKNTLVDSKEGEELGERGRDYRLRLARGALQQRVPDDAAEITDDRLSELMSPENMADLKLYRASVARLISGPHRRQNEKLRAALTNARGASDSALLQASSQLFELSVGAPRQDVRSSAYLAHSKAQDVIRYSARREDFNKHLDESINLIDETERATNDADALSEGWSRLWLDLQEISAADTFATTSVALPQRQAEKPKLVIRPFPFGATITTSHSLVDDGKLSSVKLAGGKDIHRTDVKDARLWIDNTSLPYDGITELDSGQALTFTFPSLRRLRLTDPRSTAPTINLSIEWAPPIASQRSDVMSFPLRYVFAVGAPVASVPMHVRTETQQVDYNANGVDLILSVTPDLPSDLAGKVVWPKDPAVHLVFEGGKASLPNAVNTPAGVGLVDKDIVIAARTNSKGDADTGAFAVPVHIDQLTKGKDIKITVKFGDATEEGPVISVK